MKAYWFSKSSDIFFDGYPRSGNTFLRHLTLELMPSIKAVHHLHKVAPIKIALQRKLPVFILIRKPAEAIASNYLKYYSMRKKDVPDNVNTKILKIKANNYINYYDYVNQNLPYVKIISFSFLIKHPDIVVKAIAKAVNTGIDENKIEKTLKSYVGSTDKLGSSKPNAFKQKKKAELLIELQKTNAYKQAVILYDKIIQKADFKSSTQL
jgi:hypothetical protein